MERPEPILRCQICGNDREFDTEKTFLYKVVLNGAGHEESSSRHSDVEDEDQEITCRACGAEVSPTDPVPLRNRIESSLSAVEDKRSQIMHEVSISREITVEAAEDLAVAACALTDAAEEVRAEMGRHNLRNAHTDEPKEARQC